jgi:ankyrin repeat protein
MIDTAHSTSKTPGLRNLGVLAFCPTPMKRLTLIAFALAFASAQPYAQTQTQSVQRIADGTAPIRSMLDTYCVGCHSATGRAGGVSFAGMPVDSIGNNAEIWEKAVRKLRGHLMPPPGSRQPQPGEVSGFITSLENALDSNLNRPVAGHVGIQRMTRTEYGIAVKDLLGVEIDAENLLPTENEVNGFDNIAAALSISPAFLDQYVGAARLAAKLAVGEPVPKRASARYPLPPGDQSSHIDGLPLGTRALIKGGADIDLPNPDGMTPLMMATDNSHFEVARYLLDHGANPNTWDWWGRTALYVVVNMRGGPDSNPAPRPPSSLDLVNALLNAGVNPNHQLNMLQPSRNGNSGRFKDDLLNTGATPLLRAVQTFDNDVVKTLLDHRALVDLPNAMGVTPLMAAAGIGTRTAAGVLGPGPPTDVESRSIETMGLLLKAGANVNARITDTTSLTARIARASTMTGREGQTALFFAVQSGRASVIQFLLDHGSDVNAMGDSGTSLLNAARGNVEITALILKAIPEDAGADFLPLPR